MKSFAHVQAAKPKDKGRKATCGRQRRITCGVILLTFALGCQNLFLLNAIRTTTNQQQRSSSLVDEVKEALQKRDGKTFSHCFFRTYPRPTTTDANPDLPLVGEVFASHDQSKIHIALEDRRSCQKQYRETKSNQKNRTYHCIFELDGTSTASEPVYTQDPNLIYLFVTCPVPTHLQRSLPYSGSPLTHFHVTLQTTISQLRTGDGSSFAALQEVRHLPVCSHAWPLDDVPTHAAAADPAVVPDNNNSTTSMLSQPKKKKHKVSVMTRVSVSYRRGRDYESLSVTQTEFVLWMEYHLAIGIEHFYIYDDSPAAEDSLIRAWCEPYIAKSLVTYVLYNYQDIDCDIGWRKGSMVYVGQIMSASSSLHRYRNETEWMGHWDVDEFLVLPEGATMPAFIDQVGTNMDEVGFRGPTYGECSDHGRADAVSLSEEEIILMERKKCNDGKLSALKGVYRTGAVLGFRVHFSRTTVNFTKTRRRQVSQKIAQLAHFRKGALAGSTFPHPSHAFDKWIAPMKEATRKVLQSYSNQQQQPETSASPQHPLPSLSSQQQQLQDLNRSIASRIRMDVLTRTQTKLKHEEQELSCDVSHCGGFLPNRIVAFWGPSGLGDRSNVVRQLTNLGGFLCARIVIPPPHQWLVERHNLFKAVPVELAWDDFYSVRYVGDATNSSSFFEAGSDQGTKRAWKGELAQHGYQAGLEIRTAEAPRSAWSNDFERIWLAFVEQQTQLQNGQENQPSAFLWDLSAVKISHPVMALISKMLHEEKSQSAAYKHLFVNRFVTSAKKPLPQNKLPRIPQARDDVKNACEYGRFESSAGMMQVARLVLRNVFSGDDSNNKNPTTRNTNPPNEHDQFGVIHLRRTDVTKRCDTSLGRVKEYLSCSFRGPHAQRALQQKDAGGKSKFVMFLATDEQSPQFREAALTLLQEELGVRAVDLDKEIQTAIQQLIQSNQLPPHWYGINYIVYAVGVTLKLDFGIGLNLELRRKICPICSSASVEEAFQHGRRENPRMPFHEPTT